MPSVLILSSHVAASRVGGGAQALALARLGVEPILVPTVLFGRHPGWGPPGGGPVAAETMQAMVDAIAYQGLFAELDAVICGYFARPEQVTIAARTLDFVRAANPRARLVVDPIMGDAGKGLYVAQAVAEAVTEVLVPRADLVTPNAWELSRLSDLPVFDAASAVRAARALGKPVLVSSVEVGPKGASEPEIGVVYADAHEAALAAHARQAKVPNGTGDLLTLLFAAGLIDLLPPKEALACAVGAVAEAAAAAAGEKELSVRALPTELARSPRVRVEPLP
ncbi:MAG: bifunctional hydroxymethylpyrimidine kinase/phosphomethylpyrimidine kinase [Caulobacteraceae bacterium]|nr:bifunctional hydroxymethylpyrimidine kinase/phosphomethylpyrimidine kinase [Caulobacteraceae bacterium]